MSANAFHPLQASRKHWWLIITTGALTIVCGGFGLWQYEHDHPHGEFHPLPAALAALYHSLQMLILHTPHFEHGANWGIELGRWLGAFTLVATTVMLFGQRLRREWRLMQLRNWNAHQVICGLGRRGMEVVHTLQSEHKNTRTVVIDPRPNDEAVLECERLGVCVLAGDASNPALLGQARVAHAAEVVILTPEDETNVRIAARIRELAGTRTDDPLQCHVQLANVHLRDSLQRLAETERSSRAGCRLHFFDVFDHEARRVLLAHPLDGQGIKPDDATLVHVVILGFGRMGRSIALRAAKMGHFANRKPLRLSVIDRNASRQEANLLFHYPALASGRICELNFHAAEAQSLAARQLIEKWAGEPNARLHLFVCLDTGAETLEVGLRLREALVSNRDSCLFLRIKSRASLADILELRSDAGPRIIPFGMVEDACCASAFRHGALEALARAIHEEFVNSRLADSSRRPENDPALRPWEEVSEEIRESNRQQADHIGIKLRAIGCEVAQAADPRPTITRFDPQQIELLAELEHARWNTERWLAGWRYGTPSDKDNRINEYLVDWKELHDSIKQYDRDTVIKIPTLLGLAKPPLKVVRQA